MSTKTVKNQSIPQSTASPLFNVGDLSVPSALFVDGKFETANQAFFDIFDDPESQQQIIANSRIRQALHEISIVAGQTSFDINHDDIAFRCIASPLNNHPGQVLIIFEDISVEAQSEKNNALLYRLSLLFASGRQPLQDKLQAAVDQVLFELPLFDCSVLLFNKRTGCLESCAWGTTDLNSSIDGSQKFAIGEGIVGKSVETRLPIVIPNVLTDPRFIKRPTDNQPLSLLCVPVTLNGEALGAICVSRLPGQTFSDKDVQLFTTIANRLGSIVESEQIKDDELQQHRLSDLLSSGGAISEKYPAILHCLANILQTDYQALCLYDDEAPTIAAQFSETTEEPRYRQALHGLLANQSALRHLNQHSYLTITKAMVSADSPLLGAVILPLSVRKQCFGFIVAHTTKWQRTFSEYELKIGATAAAQIAVTLENAQSHEETLNERRKMEQIQQTLRDGLILYTPDMRVAMYNQAAKHILGLKKDITNQPWETVLNQDIKQYCAYPIQRHFDPVRFLHDATELGKISVGLATIPSQPPKTVEITVAPVYDRHNKISGVLSHFHDITQIHDLQTKMASRVQQLTNLFKISSVTGFNIQQIVRRILRLVLLLMSVKTAQLLLLDEEHETKLRVLEAVGDDQILAAADSHIKRKAEIVLKTKEPVAFKLKLKKTTTPLHVLIVPVIGHHPHRNGALVIIDKEDHRYFSREDINLLSIVSTQIASKLDTAWLLNQVEEDRNKLAAIIDQSVDGILVVDTDERIQIWNQALERLTGLTEEEVKYQPLMGIRERLTVINRIVNDNLTELEIKHAKTGKTVWLGIAYAPITRDQETTGYIAIIRDISRQKELERSKNEFVSTASHELRSPITAIVGYLSMLKRGDAGQIIDKQQAFLVDKAYQNAKRMVSLIEDLLMTTRMETGQVRYQREPVDLVSIIENVMADVRFRAEEKNITITLHRIDRAKVHTDKDGIHQVLNNILTNAVKYTPVGGKVEVSFETQDGDQPTVITHITDTGVGIDQTDLDKVFEKFSRIDNPLSVSAGGTGLGLYITKGIIEELGGNIWVTSQKGKGSTFSISLPAIRRSGKERKR